MTMTVGIAKLYWRGKKYDVQKGVKWRLPGYQNEDQNATDRTLRSQRWQQGMCQATVMLTAAMSEDDFDPALGEGELQLQLDTGVTYVFPDAYTRSKPDSQDNGNAPVTWSLSTYQKITS
ncbi:phage tail tube protein [Gluconobacter morbifer]|uniref:Phage tail protein n=1 Tax=Gluconobacter morbifer G707 TaxID=1088869 RepID=G6XKW8_9PROT|nr:phage tail tube protein [Gluconobacter morbifer]EHH67563.1 hypothetical protein GMO_21340 [Gluconobacter morbifer G707]